MSGSSHEEDMANLEKERQVAYARIEKEYQERRARAAEKAVQNRALLEKIRSNKEKVARETASNNLRAVEEYKAFKNRIIEEEKLEAEKKKEAGIHLREEITAAKELRLAEHNFAENIYKNSGFWKGRKKVNIEKITKDHL